MAVDAALLVVILVFGNVLEVVGPAYARRCVVTLVVCLAMAQEAEPWVSIKHDTPGEAILLQEEVAGSAADIYVGTVLEILHNFGMAILTGEDLGVVLRLVKMLISPANVAIPAAVHQRVHASLSQITVKEERLVG